MSYQALGPAQVWWNGQDLGETMGDVIFKHMDKHVPIKVSQKGDTEIDSIRTGSETTVELTLTRRGFASLSKMIAGASGSSEQFSVYNSNIGESRYDTAQELIIKPIVNNAVSDSSKWVTAEKASPNAEYEQAHNNESQIGFKIMFTCFPREGTNKIFKVGT